jgi:DNA-binding transcriptional LysR family regulator
MQLFVRVVEEGSFSAAARFLGVTPSAVSRQVSQLEGELGARLFHRTTRKQSLTEAGEIYFQHAHRLVADLEAARLAVSRLTDTPSGSLRVTIEADFAHAYVAPILPDFLDRYPKVQVRLFMSAGMMDLVDSGIDLAIRIGHLDDSSLIARKIAMSRSLVCASPAYLERNGTPTHPSELEAHSCLSFRTQAGKNHWGFEPPQGSLDVPISGRLNANSLVFLRNAALAGLGIIMTPTWMIRDELKHGHLVALLEDFPLVPPSTPIHAVFAHNRHLAPKVRAFVDFLVERMETL